MGIFCLFLTPDQAVYLIKHGFLPKWNIWRENSWECSLLEIRPDLDESSSEQGWKQGGQGAVVARGEVRRQATSCSDVFHKGPLPNGDADFEHCMLSFSTGNLKLIVIVGLLRSWASGVFNPFLLSLSRCSIFTNRSQVSLEKNLSASLPVTSMLVSILYRRGSQGSEKLTSFLVRQLVVSKCGS